ncbi:MAG: hypothetical protein Q9202_002718 [Teloschistes flavicans]
MASQSEHSSTPRRSYVGELELQLGATQHELQECQRLNGVYIGRMGELEKEARESADEIIPLKNECKTYIAAHSKAAAWEPGYVHMKSEIDQKDREMEEMQITNDETQRLYDSTKKDLDKMEQLVKKIRSENAHLRAGDHPLNTSEVAGELMFFEDSGNNAPSARDCRASQNDAIGLKKPLQPQRLQCGSASPQPKNARDKEHCAKLKTQPSRDVHATEAAHSTGCGLQNTCKTKQARIEKLERQHSRAVENTKEAQTEARKAKNSCSALQNRIDELEKDQNNLQNQLNQERTEKKHAEEDLEKAKIAHEQTLQARKKVERGLQLSLSQKDRKLKKQAKRLQAATSRSSKLQDEIRNLSESTDPAADEDSELGTALCEVKRLKDEVKNLQERNTKLNDDLRTQNENSKMDKKEIEKEYAIKSQDLKDQYQRNFNEQMMNIEQGRQNSYEIESGTTRKELDWYKTQWGEFHSSFANFVNSLGLGLTLPTDFNHILSALSREKENTNSMVQQQEDEVKRLKEQCTQLERSPGTSDEAIEIERKYEELRESSREMLNERNYFRSKHSELTAANKKLAKEKKDVQDERKTSQKFNSEYESKNRKLEENCADLTAQQKTLEEKIQGYQREMNELTVDCDRLKRDVGGLKQKKEALEAQEYKLRKTLRANLQGKQGNQGPAKRERDEHTDVKDGPEEEDLMEEDAGEEGPGEEGPGEEGVEKEGPGEERTIKKKRTGL